MILMLGDRQTEGHDHLIALSDDQNQLAAAVLAANPHTIVVLKTGGPVLMPWKIRPHHPRSLVPGEEDGDAVAAILFGQINLSGKHRSHSRNATKIFRFKVLNNIRVLTISLTTPRSISRLSVV